MFGWFKKKQPEPLKFVCSCCGEEQVGFPAFHQVKPRGYIDTPVDERDARTKLTSDTFVKDNEYYSIRANLSIPIIGSSETLEYGLWASQSKENFDRYVATMYQDQSGDGSFGWITIDMVDWKRETEDGYLENLPCNIEWQDDDLRPLIEIQECDHPLYEAQQSGITLKRAIELFANNHGH